MVCASLCLSNALDFKYSLSLFSTSTVSYPHVLVSMCIDWKLVDKFTYFWVYLCITIKISPQVNFLAYCGSINLSISTKFLNFFDTFQYGTLEVENGVHF